MTDEKFDELREMISQGIARHAAKLDQELFESLYPEWKAFTQPAVRQATGSGALAPAGNSAVSGSCPPSFILWKDFDTSAKKEVYADFAVEPKPFPVPPVLQSWLTSTLKEIAIVDKQF